MKSDQTLYEELNEQVSDNLEWMLLFNRKKELLVDTQARRLPTRALASQGKESKGASARITPADARILIVDDCRVLDIFKRRGIEPLALLLAGERADQAWDPTTRLRVGVLTTGGNSPGLNEVVDSATKRFFESRRGQAQLNVEVYGYVGGFQGMIAKQRITLVPSRRMLGQRPAGSLQVVDEIVTDNIALEGCTRLKSLRGQEKTDEDRRKTIVQVVQAIENDELDVLLVIGGDGSTKAAHAIVEAWEKGERKRRPLAVVCAVKTMDNDVIFADPSFGFFTVVDQAIECIRRIALEAETQNRVAIIQLFGAASGFVALYAAYCSGEADWVVLPETLPQLDLNGTATDSADLEYVAFHPPVAKSVDDFVKQVESLKSSLIKRIYERLTIDKKEHAVIVLAEGATPTLANPQIVAEQKQGGTHQHDDAFRAIKETAFQDFVRWMKDELKKRKLANEVMASLPQHLIRATGPNGFDAALCKYTGKLAADTALAGYTDCAVSMWHGRPVLVPLPMIVDQKKYVQPNSYFAASMLRKLSFGHAGEAANSTADAPPRPEAT